MKFFKSIAALITSAVLTFALVGCGSNSKDDSNANEGSSNDTTNSTNLKETINFGLMPSIDAIPFIIARDKGFFDEEGVKVNLETFKAAKDRDAAFQSGTLDGIITDLVAIGLYNEGDFNVKVTGDTTGLFTLLTTNEVSKVQDLKGKKVIVSKNTAIEYTLDTMLKSEGLADTDVEKVEVPAIPTRLELLKEGQADAAVLPDPFATMGTAANLSGIITNKDVNINPFVTGFTEDVLGAKKEEIKAFYRAYDKAVDYLNSHDLTDYIDLVIKEVGYPEDLKDQIQLPEFTKNILPSETDINSAFQWLKEKGTLTKELKPSDVLFDVTK